MNEKPPAEGQGPLEIGDRAPDFRLAADDGQQVSLASLRGRHAVLYFFPKALTPG